MDEWITKDYQIFCTLDYLSCSLVDIIASKVKDEGMYAYALIAARMCLDPPPPCPISLPPPFPHSPLSLPSPFPNPLRLTPGVRAAEQRATTACLATKFPHHPPSHPEKRKK